jgi:hypothetical protein
MVINLHKAIHGEKFYEYSFIVFAYLSAMNAYQFRYLSDRKNLIMAIAAGITALGCLTAFLMRG